LSMCANARCNYYLRSLLPSQAEGFATQHDEAMAAALWQLLDHPAASEHQLDHSKFVLQLPVRMGGLGLRSARRMTPAACWASWADCLHMISQRTPAVQEQILHDLMSANPRTTCSAEVVARANCLGNEGFAMNPGWEQLCAGARPEAQSFREPGEWTHGWQYYAASCRDEVARTGLLLRPPIRRAAKALIRSQSGTFAGRSFTVVPTSDLTTIPAPEMRILLLRRLHLPLSLSLRRCSC
jgi:hypothetical protein